MQMQITVVNYYMHWAFLVQYCYLWCCLLVCHVWECLHAFICVAFASLYYYHYYFNDYMRSALLNIDDDGDNWDRMNITLMNGRLVCRRSARLNESIGDSLKLIADIHQSLLFLECLHVYLIYLSRIAKCICFKLQNKFVSKGWLVMSKLKKYHKDSSDLGATWLSWLLTNVDHIAQLAPKSNKVNY